MVEKVLRLEADFDGKKAEAGLEDMEKMCDETKAKIESLTTELGFKIKPVTILKESDLKKAEKRLEEIRKEIEHITSETDKLLSQAVTDGQAQNILAMEAEELKKLTAEQEVLNEAVAKYKTERATIAAEKQRGQDIKSVNSDVSESGKADEFVSKIKTAEQYRLELDRVQSRMSEIEAETARLAAQKGINPNDALAANKEYQRLNKRLEALASTTRKFKRTSSGAFGDAKKQAQSMGESMKKAIKTMSKYTLAVFGARSAFFAVKNAIRQVLSDNEELNNTVTAIKGVFSNALAPYVERLVSIIQYGLAYLNLFIKTLTGVDMVADYNAKALKKQAAATRENAKAAKEASAQLAAFDEMNVLSSTNSGQSSVDDVESVAPTLSLPDVSGGEFEKICETIKKHLAEVETAAGVALLGIGFILLACGQIPLGIAAIIGGISIMAVAIGSWDSLSREAQNIITAIIGIAGSAFLVLGIILCCTGVAVPLGIALIAAGAAGLVTVIALNFNIIRDWVEKVWDSVKNFWNSKIKPIFTFEFWTNKLSPIAQGVRNVTEMLLSYLKRFWDSIKNFWNSKIKPIFTFEFWTNKLSPIAQGVRNVTDTLLSNLKKFWNSVTSYWNAKIKPKFTIEFWTNKLSPIAQGGRNAINTLLSYIERGLNWIVKRVNAISFSVPEWVPGIGGSRVGFNLAPVSLPRLAKGAIVNNPGRGVDINAGEAGREAILPLDNYTEWMDELADKIAARISFPIINKFIVGDKEICSIYKKYQAKFNLETNGGVL